MTDSDCKICALWGTDVKICKVFSRGLTRGRERFLTIGYCFLEIFNKASCHGGRQIRDRVVPPTNENPDM